VNRPQVSNHKGEKEVDRWSLKKQKNDENYRKHGIVKKTIENY
jgi:hypothetical protein